MKKLVILIIAFFSINQAIFAQWTQVGLQPLGAEISSIIKLNNLLFVSTKTNGVYSTSDEANWSFANTGLTDLKVNDMTESNGTLAVGTKDAGVFVSTDNGASWQQKSNGLTIPFQALPNVNTIIFSGGNMIEGGGFGIFISTDNGENWSRTFMSSIGVRGLYKSPNFIYAGIGAIAYRSSDNGITWNLLVNSQNTTVKEFETLPLADGQDKIFIGTLDGIFFSDNDGVTWVKKNISYNNINDLAKYNNNIFAVAEPFMTNDAGFVFVSSDLGDSWTDITANISSVAGNHIKKIYIDGEYIYVGTSLGYVYKRNLSDVVTAIDESGENIPTGFSLMQNYPNPFNPSTTISFTIPNSEFVTLKVYDILGNEVATLVNEYKSAGIYNYQFSISNFQLSSGVYFYKLQAGSFTEMKKMILMK